jgi:chromosome segregation ATPase
MDPTHDPVPDEPHAGGTSQPEPDALRSQREALRIQAAAVVAQQAALTEEELRLEERRLALDQQEQQLAAHLEEKRQYLVTLGDEARNARSALEHERKAFEDRVAGVLQALERSRREVADGTEQNRVERQRLLVLRRRMIARWRRRWAGERAALERRESQLGQQRQAWAQERERLQQDRVKFNQAKLRWNGEMELGRRRLQEEWSQLRKEQAEFQARLLSLEERETALSEADHSLAGDKHSWEGRRRQLEEEIQGLETRIQNYRRRIEEQEQQLNQHNPVRGCSEPEPAVPGVALLPVVSNAASEDCLDQLVGERAAALERLAGELADQRLYLVEEFERMAQARQHWEEEHEKAIAELETLARQLQRREDDLSSREEALVTDEQSLRKHSDELGRTRLQLEAAEARLNASSAAWEGERERSRAEFQAREALVSQRLMQLDQLRQRWQERRRRQVLRMRSRRDAFEQLRQRCRQVEDEWSKQQTALARERRSLAEQALALEQYRQECISRAPNSAAAERRMERLRRRWTALVKAERRSGDVDHGRFQRERALLEEQWRELQGREKELEVLDADLASRRTDWEHHEAWHEAHQHSLYRQLESFRQQRTYYEQQVASLLAEVDRLARLFLEEDGGQRFPVPQAA